MDIPERGGVPTVNFVGLLLVFDDIDRAGTRDKIEYHGVAFAVVLRQNKVEEILPFGKQGRVERDRRRIVLPRLAVAQRFGNGGPDRRIVVGRSYRDNKSHALSRFLCRPIKF